MTPSQRAAAGAALLSEKIPRWREEIDPSLLDIIQPGLCILGQLGGGLMTGGMKRLGMDFSLASYEMNMQKLIDLGLMGVNDDVTYTQDCEVLTAEWRKLL